MQLTLFRLQAANDPLSGLVALLTAARMLGNASIAAGSPAAASGYQKRVVFACMAGEPWGLMGTRRLLLEARQGTAAMDGFQPELIEQVRQALGGLDAWLARPGAWWAPGRCC